MVTPDIHQIIKKSLSIGKNIMFYLPRLIDIRELFEILRDVTERDCIFLDIHVLESANKIKAILLLYGPNVATVNKNDIQNFITMLTDPNASMDSKGSDNFVDYKSTTIINRKMSNSDDSSPDYFITENECTSNSFNSTTNLESKANSYSKNNNPFTNNKDCESPHKVLWKIYSIIGLKKFFESLIKFKEKYEPLDLKQQGCKNYLPKYEKLNDLITFLLKEVLTDKQLTRIHL